MTKDEKLSNWETRNTVKLVNCQRQDELPSVTVCKLPSLRVVLQSDGV